MALVSEGNQALTHTEVQCFAEDVHGKAWREVSLVHMGAGESGVFLCTGQWRKRKMG